MACETIEKLHQATAEIDHQAFITHSEDRLRARGLECNLAGDTLFVEVLFYTLSNQLPPISHSVNLQHLCTDIAKEDPENKLLLNSFYCASMLLANYIKVHGTRPESTLLSTVSLHLGMELCDANISSIPDIPSDISTEALKAKILFCTFGKTNPTNIKESFKNNVTSIIVAAKNSFLSATK